MRLIALSACLALIGAAAVTGAAEAVAYCRAAGVPKGCVARPTRGAAGLGVRPGVGAGAPGAGLTRAAGPGVGPNVGGPVNRVGAR